MNLFFQLSLVFFIGLIGFAVLIVKKKAFQRLPVSVAFGFLTLLVCSLFLGFNSMGQAKEVENVDKMNSAVVCEFLLNNNPDDAETFFLEYSTELNSESALDYARILAYKGDFKGSAAMYEKARLLYEEKKKSKDFPAGEYGAVCQNIYNGVNDQVLIDYASQPGADLTGIEVDTKAKAYTHERIIDIVEDSLKKEAEDTKKNADNDDISAAVSAAGKISAEYKKYMEDGTFDSELVLKAHKRLEDLLIKSPFFGSYDYFKISLIKSSILTKKYDSTMALLQENIGARGLMIISEMYMKGLLKKSDFPEGFAAISTDQYSAVIEQCKNILDKNDFDKETRAKIKDRIKSLETMSKNSILIELEQRIAGAISIEKEMQSQGNMQIAKIEKYIGNAAVADSSIDDAFSTLGESTDDNYSKPMQELQSIISGEEDDYNKIKESAEYVKQIVDNVLVVDVTGDSSSSSDDNNDKDDTSADFETTLVEYVSKKQATVTIGAIDTSKFSTVTARIQLDSNVAYKADSLKELLTISDCGIKVTDYTLEKMEFSQTKVLLVCDNSGSMSGNIDALKNAVDTYAKGIEESESIGVTAFDSDILFFDDFTTDQANIQATIAKFGAYGGTNIVNAISDSVTRFPFDLKANHVMLVMTDGQDNTMRSEVELKALCETATNKGIIVYTLGLGQGVEGNYLSTIAKYGGGKYVYIDSQDSMSAIFSFLHGQVNNQYLLTFKALDTIQNKRELRIEIPSEGAQDKKTYFLDDSLDDGTGYEPITSQGVSVYGLDTKFMYKSNNSSTVRLLGSGFIQDTTIAVKISGSVSYDLESAFVNDTTMNLIIPANVSPGVYTLQVATQGKTFSLQRELTIALTGQEKSFKVGPYTFTALSISPNGFKRELSGNVTMNGWLHFKGNVTIEGAKDSYNATVTDNDGTYVSYTGISDSKGLAKTLGALGHFLEIAPLGTFKLYADNTGKIGSSDYTVDDIHAGLLSMDYMDIQRLVINLYPDRLKIIAHKINLNLPFQKTILKSADINPFGFETDFNVIIGSKTIGLSAKLLVKDETDDKDLLPISIVNLPIGIKKLDIKIDTYKNDYSFEAQVKLRNMPLSAEAIGFKFAIKDGRFDEVRLYCDTNWTPILQPVPITFSKFSLGITGMASKVSTYKNNNEVYDTAVVIGFNLDVAKAAAIVPALKSLVGDASLCSMENAAASIALRRISICFDADFKLLGDIDFGKVEVKMGTFEYANALLGINDFTTHGLYAKLNRGIDWNIASCLIQVKGMSEVVLSTRYCGVWLSGVFNYDIKWWIVPVANGNITADGLIGVYTNSSDERQFSIIIRGNVDNISGSVQLHVSEKESYTEVNLP